MSRYIGPKIRIIRRLGELPGLTKKITARKYGPGQHGPSKLTKKLTPSDFPHSSANCFEFMLNPV